MKINLPKWMQRDKLQLPDWARLMEVADTSVSVNIEVDTNKAMREWIGLLGSPPLDQYWLEVAYQCVKLDVQQAIAGTEYDPRVAGKSAQFHFTRADQWAQKKHPVGKGAVAASQGKEARGHYVRIRGSMPM